MTTHAHSWRQSSSTVAIVLLLLAGCQSPYHADQGALVGGLGGAGVGALVGGATRHPVAGALVGAGVGAVSGGLVGGALDNIEAKNRAQIASQMGRQIPPGGVQMNDIIAMQSSNVPEELIINHIRGNGMMQPLQAGDLIALQQLGVSKNVIAAMQTTPPRSAAPQPVAMPPQAYYYYPPQPTPYWGVGF